MEKLHHNLKATSVKNSTVVEMLFLDNEQFDIFMKIEI